MSEANEMRIEIRPKNKKSNNNRN